MEERSFYYRYCIIIPDKYPKLSQYFETSLKSYDFDIQTFEENKKKYFCISQTNEQRMLKEAENLKIKKQKNKEIPQDEALLLDKRIIELEKKEYFISEKYNEYIPSKEYNEFYDLLSKDKKDDINRRYGLGLFTESEMLCIEKSILENIPISNLDEFNEILSSEENKNDSPLLKEINEIKNKKRIIEENSLFNTLISYNIIEDYFALHIGDFFLKIKKKFANKENPNLIRSYFNDEVALYFAWLYHYTKFIFIPAIIATIIYFSNKFVIKGKIAEMLNIFYALGMTIWVQIFIIFWNRKESSYKFLWDNDSKEYEKEDKRKEFVGDIKKDLVTGKDELFYSEKKQIINYLRSFFVTLIFICIAIYINIISLNMRGLIPEDRHPFLVISKYHKPKSEKKGSSIYQLLIKSIAISFFGNIFNKINELLTENENHRSKTHYYNSFIIKKFIFESLNYFFDIFYIAFALRDLKETTSTIKVYFYLRKYFRIIWEYIFPFINDIFFMKPEDERKKEEAKEKENEKNFEKRFILGEPIDQKEVINQSKLPKFNSFSEYYPFMQEFCFLTLFASCAPLGPLLILINNSLEIKSDLNKFCTETRRPEVTKKRNIGAWKYIIEFIGIMSILSNIMFCYLYNDTVGETKYSLFSFILGEHVLLLIIIALRFFIPLNDGWVKIYKLRKFFRRREEYKIKLEKVKEIKEKKE